MRALPGFFALLALTTPGLLRADEKPILVLDAGGHTSRVGKVLFTLDGKEVITVSDDKTIRFWNAAGGRPAPGVLRPPIGKGPEGRLDAAALSPDGQTLAVGGYGFVDHKGGISTRPRRTVGSNEHLPVTRALLTAWHSPPMASGFYPEATTSRQRYGMWQRATASRH